jgi:hypothetical protein
VPSADAQLTRNKRAEEDPHAVRDHVVASRIASQQLQCSGVEARRHAQSSTSTIKGETMKGRIWVCGAIAVGLMTSSASVFAQTRVYNTWVSGNPTQTMYPSDEWYCGLSGVFNLGWDQSNDTPIDAVWVDIDVNGNWELTGQAAPTGRARVGGSAYCYRYSTIQSPYHLNPSPTFMPSGSQWYSSNGTAIWDTRAFCHIGGMKYDGNPFPGSTTSPIRFFTLEHYPHDSSVVANSEGIQFATSGIPDAIEGQCLWFPGTSTNVGFFASGAFTSQSHNPAPGEIVFYGSSGSSSGSLVLGSSAAQMCQLTQVAASRSGGALSAYLLDTNGLWYLAWSNTAYVEAACIKLWQPWPGN